jgi:hypothetical protein
MKASDKGEQNDITPCAQELCLTFCVCRPLACVGGTRQLAKALEFAVRRCWHKPALGHSHAVSLQPEQNLWVLVGDLCPDGLIFLSETLSVNTVPFSSTACRSRFCLLSVNLDRIAQPNVMRLSRREESGLEDERF